MFLVQLSQYDITFLGRGCKHDILPLRTSSLGLGLGKISYELWAIQNKNMSYTPPTS